MLKTTTLLAVCGVLWVAPCSAGELACDTPDAPNRLIDTAKLYSQLHNKYWAGEYYADLIQKTFSMPGVGEYQSFSSQHCWISAEPLRRGAVLRASVLHLKGGALHFRVYGAYRPGESVARLPTIWVVRYWTTKEA